MTDTIIQYLTLAGTCLASIGAIIGTCVGTIKKIKNTFNNSESAAEKRNIEMVRQLNSVIQENAELKQLLIEEKNARLHIAEAKVDVKKTKNIHR